VGALEMDLDPSECLAFEDSHAGVLSAKRAGMKVIAVSDKEIPEADKWITSLDGLDLSILTI